MTVAGHRAGAGPATGRSVADRARSRAGLLLLIAGSAVVLGITTAEVS